MTYTTTTGNLARRGCPTCFYIFGFHNLLEIVFSYTHFTGIPSFAPSTPLYNMSTGSCGRFFQDKFGKMRSASASLLPDKRDESELNLLFVFFVTVKSLFQNLFLIPDPSD